MNIGSFLIDVLKIGVINFFIRQLQYIDDSKWNWSKVLLSIAILLKGWFSS